MKKLLMFCATVALACSVHAGAYIWGFSGGCDDPSGSSGGWYEGATAFLYLGTVSFDASSGTWNTSGATLLASAGYDGAMGYGALDDGANPLSASDAVSATGGDAYTLVLVDGTGVTSLSGYTGEGKYAYVESGTSAGTYRMVGTDVEYFATMTSDTFIDNISAQPTGGWMELKGSSSPTPGVPEPTSGLLLVVGGAMLALRRRRA